MTLLGCSDASGTIQGGDSIFDGGQPAVFVSDAASEAGVSVLPCEADGGNTGSGWQDLYACYFGPSGIANCSLTSLCHGPGGASAAIWQCDTTVAGCRQGMIAGGLVPTTSGTDPTQSSLFGALRKANPGSGQLNNMPVSPATLVFSTDDLTRISTWIQGGAPNN
jgi:hypothetical protein